MSIKETRCVEIECDECGDGWSGADEDYGTPHFPAGSDIAEKLRDYDWTVDGGKHYCRSCSNKRTCAREGHNLRTLPKFGDYPALTICERCDHLEHKEQA